MANQRAGLSADTATATSAYSGGRLVPQSAFSHFAPGGAHLVSPPSILTAHQTMRGAKPAQAGKSRVTTHPAAITLWRRSSLPRATNVQVREKEQRVVAMPQPNADSFAQVWTMAQHRRSFYGRLLLRRAYRMGRTWVRRRLSAGGVGAMRPQAHAGDIAPATSRVAR
jgi:hypothetical protein